MAKSVIYLKKSLKSFLIHPMPGNILLFMKYYPAWLKYLQPGLNAVTEKLPWISFSAIDFIKKMVRKDMIVFEYGSGGSTLFWASRVKKIISVEHDPEWYLRMKTALELQQIKNVEYILAEPVNDAQFSEKQFENPDHFVSSDKDYPGKNFEDYVRKIDHYPDRFFDMIIVDGRARPSCIKYSLSKLKTNGLLIVDNTERKYYLAPFPFNKGSWKIRTFAGPVPFMYDFSETTILEKRN